MRSLISLKALRVFINALKQRLLSHRDFEAVQTVLNVLLRIHGDVITANVELQGDLEELLVVEQKESQRILDLVASSLGTLGFVRDT